MAAQIRLDRQNYERAIVRILSEKLNEKDKPTVIGTGFLIAPGYVLTCAHVVLQAMTISQKEFASHKHQPKKEITLDFPLFVDVREMKSEIVAWIPYDVSEGDVAVLRLKGHAPQGAKPLLISQLLTDSEDSTYSVYGFGEPYGDRSDAYTPKTYSYGRRLQLRKTGNPADETIKPGYSGAPVWHDQQHYVIGMVATVSEEREGRQDIAFAITREILEPVLQSVSALRLCDVLLQCMNGCSDDEKLNLEAEIADAFGLCNANSDLKKDAWDAQMLALMDLPVAEDWKEEGNLVRFVMKLATKRFAQRISLPVYDALSSWVSEQGFEFPTLLNRLGREPSEQVSDSGLPKENVLVLVKAITGSVEKLEVFMWAIANRETYTPDNPPGYILHQEKVDFYDLPLLISAQIKDEFGTSKPVIHLFVPPALIERDIEMQLSTKKGHRVLGREYPLVLRMDLEAACPEARSNFYKQRWIEKWESIEASLQGEVIDIFASIDCSVEEDDLIDVLEDTCAAILENNSNLGVRNVFDLAAEIEAPLPIAIWTRDESCLPPLSNVLEGTVEDFHERVRQEREKAHKSKAKDSLGHNLSLVWEDPKIVPPKMPDLTQEAF